MKTRFWMLIAVGIAVVGMLSTDIAFGRGGRGGGFSGGGGRGGGGGRVGGGGGGISRPSGGMSRPSGGMSRPSGGISRPSGGRSIGSSPSISRPNIGGGGASRPAVSRPSNIGGGNRPSIGGGGRPNVGGGIAGGNRPSLPSGNRPNLSPGGGSRISNLPANRIGGGGIGQGGIGGGIGQGGGIGTRPGQGGAGTAARPGIIQPGAGGAGTRLPGLAGGAGSRLPGFDGGAGSRLPGLDGGAGSRLPNQGAGIQDRMADRPQSRDERRSDLQDRMASREGDRGDRRDDRQDDRGDRRDDRGDRQDNRNDRQDDRQDWRDDRQDWRDNNREDWQNWADGHMANHDWYHGCWGGDWYPGAGWNYMWDNYPVAAAFGVTAWGINRIGYGWGYWGYSNPYATSVSTSYDYSQPIVVYADAGSSSAAPVEAPTTVAPATTQVAPSVAPPEAATWALEDARTAFYSGDAKQALTLLDQAIKASPNDTALHEFRGLVLFSLKKYPEAAAAIYAVLSAGPGWNWTTMIGLYSGVDAYTEQLRALEAYTKSNPKSGDAHFLLGYHYLTAGHAEQASQKFKAAQKLLPNDRLLSQLVGMSTPPDETRPTATAPVVDVPAEKVLSAEKLVGTWKASSQGAQFQLELTKDGNFVWTYSRGQTKQTMKGVFAVDQNNLALEPDDSGDPMLAEIDFSNPSQFKFKMVGDNAGDPGLDFKKG